MIIVFLRIKIFEQEKLLFNLKLKHIIFIIKMDNSDRPNRRNSKCRTCNNYSNRLNKDNICRICLTKSHRHNNNNNKKRNFNDSENKDTPPPISPKKKRFIICNESDKNELDFFLRRLFDTPEEYRGRQNNRTLVVNNSSDEEKIDKENNENCQKEDYKKYPYEWLGNNIKTIKDLIKLGKKYNPKLEKRFNLNLKKLNKLVTPLQDLENMIGLEELKQMIFEQIIYFMQELDNKNTDMLHTVIEGPPGVGKTEISKIIARIYKGLGFLKNDKIVSVKRDDFIAKYLGQTANKTRNKIEEALGGVLFIDEAYSLGSKEGHDSYSKEAIDMLTSYLSEHPHDLVCIVAGYQKSLKEAFFSKNEGLERRFGYRFQINPYQGQELRLIFFKIVRENFWNIYDESQIPIDFFEKNKIYFKFNGGDMLTLFSFCKKTHSKRLLYIPTEKELLENKKKLTIEDLNKGFELFLKNPENSNRIKNEDSKIKTMYS